jgi:hypothetical protein
MSGGGGSQTTKQELPDYAQPYAQQILQRGADLSNQQMPQYGGQLVAGLNDNQNAAINQVQGLATGGNPTLSAANNAATGIANNASNPYQTSNQYIGQNVQASQNPYATMQNPYLDAQVNKAQTDITNQYKNGTSAQTMAQFRNSGAFGGSAMQQYQDQQNTNLANDLTNVESQLRGNAYANTQAAAGQQAALNTQTALANQANNLNYTQGQNALNSQNYQAAQTNALNAASLAPSLNQANYYGAGQLLNAGTIQQQAAQNQLGADYQQWYNREYSPYQQLGVLQSALSGALGSGAQGVTTASQSGGNALTGALGGAASGAAIGSTFGPWGTAIGGAAGGLLGAFK